MAEISEACEADFYNGGRLMERIEYLIAETNIQTVTPDPAADANDIIRGGRNKFDGLNHTDAKEIATAIVPKLQYEFESCAKEAFPNIFSKRSQAS